MTPDNRLERLVVLDAGKVVLDGLATRHVVTAVARMTGADETEVGTFFEDVINIPTSTGRFGESWAYALLQERFGGFDAQHVARVARERTQGLAGVADILAKLQAHATVVMLSNYISGWLRGALRHQGLDQYFTRVFVSSESGLRKPDLEAYRQVIEAWGRPADTIVFVDDQIENVEAATAVGMHGIHSVSDPAHWRGEVMAWLDSSRAHVGTT